MSDPLPESKPKPARPLNRWSAGTVSVLQIVFLAVFLIAANYLSAHHFWRWDLSRQSDYTLSPKTRGFPSRPTAFSTGTGGTIMR